jgi:CRP-like cAMP-binding protein
MRVAPISSLVQSQLVAMALRVPEPKGAVLFRRDEPAFGVFLLLKGHISLRLESGEGKTIWNRVVNEGSIVGLPATVSGGRYSLTAVTLEECEVAFLDRQKLIQQLEDDPSITLELVRALGEEVLQTRALLASS